MSTLESEWYAVFAKVREQGQRYAVPSSESNLFLAFLSKADFYLDPDTSQNFYDILFEVVPWEWAATVFGLNKAKYWPHTIPASLFHIRQVNPGVLIKTLGIGTDDNVAEGSWYMLRLEEKESELTGDLYDPDIDM